MNKRLALPAYFIAGSPVESIGAFCRSIGLMQNRWQVVISHKSVTHRQSTLAPGSLGESRLGASYCTKTLASSPSPGGIRTGYLSQEVLQNDPVKEHYAGRTTSRSVRTSGTTSNKVLFVFLELRSFLRGVTDISPRIGFSGFCACVVNLLSHSFPSLLIILSRAGNNRRGRVSASTETVTSAERIG